MGPSVAEGSSILRAGVPLQPRQPQERADRMSQPALGMMDLSFMELLGRSHDEAGWVDVASPGHSTRRQNSADDRWRR